MLAALGTREAIASALAANDDPQDTDATYRALRDLVTTSSPPSLTGRKLEELLALDRGVEWLEAARVSPLPPRDEIARRIERQKLLEPLTRLVTGFEGREQEMKDLRVYVDALPAQSVGEGLLRVSRRLRYVFKDRPPLVVHGPGGAGKSTLIAKFILDHAADQVSPMAFSVLDFDRSTLDPTRPDALLLEVAGQLRVQFPQHAGELEALAEAVERRLDAEESQQVAASPHYAQSENVRASLADVIDRIASETKRNVLFTIDTFEIVQRRGPTAVYTLLDFAAGLLSRVTRLRVVIVGRGELRREDFPFSDDIVMGQPLPVLGFDAEGGRAYLRKRLSRLQAVAVSDADLDRLVLRVRGNPLGLRLAAQVFAREGLRGVEEAIGRQELDESVAEEQLQGLLHARIVEHLEDPDLQKIASPGLIVRRITRQVIEQVLAGACQLDLHKASASTLFDALRREVSLVEIVDDDTLRHRTDVRLIMLPALRRELGATARNLDDAAVRYWSGQPGPEARAEELYHRLWRRDPTAELDGRWTPEAASYLEDALDEFQSVAPDDWSRIWLAQKLDRELPEALRKRSDQISFERDVERKARRLVSDGKLDEALSVLYERPLEARLPGSALWLLEIDVRLLRGELDEASRILDLAYKRLGDTLDSEHRAALLSRRVTIQERQLRLDDARHTAGEAVALARVAHDKVSLFMCGVTLSRLARKTNHLDDDDVIMLRSELVRLIDDRAVHRALSERPSLLREAAAELGVDNRNLLADALDRFGLESESGSGEVAVPESLGDLVHGFSEILPSEEAQAGRRSLGSYIAEHVRADRVTPEALGDIAELYANSVEKLNKQTLV